MSSESHDEQPRDAAHPTHDEIVAREGHDVEPAEPIDNPGLPEHLPRPTDVDPKLEKRAERQVAGMFTAAIVLAVGFCVAYFTVPKDAEIFGWFSLNLALGLTLGGALFLIGIGAIQWAKKLMADHEVIEMRHPARSSDEDREAALEAVDAGVDESGFGRRPLIRNSLIGAVAFLGLPAIVMLRDLGPLPGDKPFNTVWRKGMRVVNDVSGEPLSPGDIEVGQLVNAQPSVFFETDSHGHAVFHGTELLQAKAKASVIVVRIRPDDITPRKGQSNWDVDGIMVYSKICTHVGCPISLWEQQTHHLLCPCHQTTYDLADGGKVIFGPGHRPLPQLPLAVDEDGYLIATSDFREPVGPSFPEVHQNRD
ncbi:Rieske 2Fe-2S domain-containing protein [Mumia zhuanghuii]|uniref:Cytochrome bc1 complex Rieske iron-sulfur subunit n=2 Tax=Mumia TaxID=1546255 RepID=A0ABW1QLN4_9ACTN|nr:MULTISPECIES: Rieske 2Fe-2S domain-containing protein [Mumia]KAA1423527.1 Rieske 2Fe-2S domain-containing protein [Mumia zhuanghuii]